MSDLQKYFELQERVNELTESIPLLEQIKTLKLEVSKLKTELVNARKLTSKHRRANDQLRDRYDVKRVSRSSKARELIKARELGDKSLTLKEIAAKTFLGYSTIKKMVKGVREGL